MANEEHQDLIGQGIEVWNRWRRGQPEVRPDLGGMCFQTVAARGEDAVTVRGMNLEGFDLRGADLSRANLWMARLQSADLRGADLQGAYLRQANLTDAKLRETCLSGADLTGACLIGADLTRADLTNAELSECDLTRVCLVQAAIVHTKLHKAVLHKAEFLDARCYFADFSECEAPKANFFHAKLQRCDFTRANLEGASFRNADCLQSTFAYAKARTADLSEAGLIAAVFMETDLSGATLDHASLEGALLIRTDLSGARLRWTRTYGASVWEIVTDDKTEQRRLPIDPLDDSEEPMLLVDDIEVAQFLYLLRDHKRLGKIINALTRRLVLLLGPFKDGGLERLRAVAEGLKSTELYEQKYWPVIFNFEQPDDRDLEEAARLLVGLSRFVIADVGGPSVGHELAATVASFHVPFVPIIRQGGKPYALFPSVAREDHVLPLVSYEDTGDLEGRLGKIVEAAEKERERLRAKLEAAQGGDVEG
jgi:uncharacterized protein YjbI with pentapeptide repeats